MKKRSLYHNLEDDPVLVRKKKSRIYSVQGEKKSLVRRKEKVKCRFLE